MTKYDRSHTLLIAHASYESRCLGFVNETEERFTSAIVIANEDSSRNRRYRENFAKLLSKLSDQGAFQIKEIVIRRSPQMAYLSELDRAYNSITDISDIVIDISTFPRDRLLMTLNYVRRRFAAKHVSIVVTSPKEYATERAEGDRWLSEGVKRLEPVIGFNGHQKPSLDCLLILQLGHEKERPKIVANWLEPDEVAILGQGGKQYSELSYQIFKKTNESLLLDLAGKTKSYSEIDHHDWISVRDEIARIRCAFTKTHNIFLAPNGTKTQLLGAFGAAVTFPEIQVVYAEPQRYNFQASSGIGDTTRFSLFDIVGE